MAQIEAHYLWGLFRTMKRVDQLFSSNAEFLNPKWKMALKTASKCTKLRFKLMMKNRNRQRLIRLISKLSLQCWNSAAEYFKTLLRYFYSLTMSHIWFLHLCSFQEPGHLVGFEMSYFMFLWSFDLKFRISCLIRCQTSISLSQNRCLYSEKSSSNPWSSFNFSFVSEIYSK